MHACARRSIHSSQRASQPASLSLSALAHLLGKVGVAGMPAACRAVRPAEEQQQQRSNG